MDELLSLTTALRALADGLGAVRENVIEWMRLIAAYWKPSAGSSWNLSPIAGSAWSPISLGLGQDTYDSEMILRELYYQRKMGPDLQRLLRERYPLTHGQMSPLAMPLVSKVIDRLATVYLTPPRRILIRDGEAMDAGDSTADLATNILRRAQYDAYWRRQDRRAALFRTTFGRIYADDVARCLTLRTFAPYDVLRVPDPGFPEDLDRDLAVALRVNGPLGRGQLGRPKDERWELWINRRGQMNQVLGFNAGPPAWATLIVNGLGEPQTEVQSGFTDGASEQVFPLVVLYDEPPNGAAYLDGGHDLLVMAQALNLAMSDLHHLIKYQAHDQLAVFGVEAKERPTITGPGAVHMFGSPTARMESISHAPKIDEARQAILTTLALFGAMRDLPIGEFNPAHSVPNAKALQVEERALRERRILGITLRAEDERSHFRRICGVWNARAEAWGQPKLPPDLELEWSPGPMTLPIDLQEVQMRHFQDVAVGAGSLIDYVVERDGVDRATAIRTVERAKRELEQHPPLTRLDIGPKGTAESAAALPGARPASSTAENTTTAAVQRVADRLRVVTQGE